MPPKLEHPPTRADEIMRARSLTLAKAAERGGFHRSNLGRILAGKMAMTMKTMERLAQVFECDMNHLTEPIGAPIPSRPGLDQTEIVGEGYVQRLQAMASMIGTDVDGMMRFQVYGDMSKIPESHATRLRKAMAA